MLLFKKFKSTIVIYFVIVLSILITFFVQFIFNNSIRINQDDFFNLMINNQVNNIIVKHRNLIYVFLRTKETYRGIDNTLKLNKYSYFLPYYKFEIGNLYLFERKFDIIRNKFHVNTTIDFYNDYEFNIIDYINDYGFLVFFILSVWYFLSKRISNSSGSNNVIFNIGKSKAKLFDPKKKIKIKFKNVAGMYEVKEEIKEVVDFLQNSKKYTRLGGKIPRGLLLIGPPGTGKTLLAKAVAGEAKVPFFSLSGSDFVEMFVGIGASRVRDLFDNAKLYSPCIIFIDEIDAIGRSRGKINITGANDERENTLNQLLTEMDGFNSKNNVIVIAATNRVDILDSALLRPGRFDRHIIIDLPELLDRKEIFEIYLKRLKLSKKVNSNFLSKQTPGFSGADISNICNEAAIIAARMNKNCVEVDDFLEAIDRIVTGLKKSSRVIKKSEKIRIAYHEAGHALVSWLLKYSSPLVKISIIPRGNSLGATWYLPDERKISTYEQICDDICVSLGGRAAEDIIFNSISTGAVDDLSKVTKQAKNMVLYFGFSKLGNISFYDINKDTEEYYFTKPYSEKTSQIIDKEIISIINIQYKRAKNIINKNIKILHNIYKKLMLKEVIFKRDLEKIFNLKNIKK